MAGSYRDRRGYVFTSGDRIFRGVSPAAAEVQREFLGSPVFARLVSGGRLIGTRVFFEKPRGTVSVTG